MKKLLGVIISLLMFIPLAVLADMSGPLVREFEFEITNPNGAVLYESDYTSEEEKFIKTNKVAPYGLKFTSDAEEIGEYIYVDSKKYKGYIKSSDSRVIVEDFKITSKELGEKEDIIVLVDIEIKKGPSNAYAGTGTIIKAGTKLTASPILKYDEEEKAYKEEKFDPWLYVEYNKIKGYVIAYEGTIGFDLGVKNAITSTKVGMYNSIKDEKPFLTIPANTKIKTYTYKLDMWSSAYYIEYNGKKGIVHDGDYIVEGEGLEYTTVKELQVYEKLDVDDNYKVNSKVVGTIPSGTKGVSYYWGSENWADFFRYEKGNVNGWIYVATYEDDNENYSESDYILLNFPWEDEEDDDNENIEVDDSEESTDDIEAVPDDEINDPEPYEPYTIPRRDSSMETLYLCIAVAVIIAITVVVTITLVNKNKSEEPKSVEEQKK